MIKAGNAICTQYSHLRGSGGSICLGERSVVNGSSRFALPDGDPYLDMSYVGSEMFMALEPLQSLVK